VQPFLIIICGPTGIGKTNVGIELAKHFGSVIISTDSRQIFKEMSIGTAVPAKDQQLSVPHLFLQTHSIHDSYNASKYETEVNEFLSEYFKKNKIAIMVGGSGLYIDAVCNGIDDLPTIDKTVREKWHLIYKEKGIEYLQQKVSETDPEYYLKADRNNPKRLQKAMEVFEMTGKPYSSFLTRQIKERIFIPVKISLNTNREELYRRINMRVDKMIESGLLDEAKSLYPFRHLGPLNTVGYKELFDYLDDKISLDEAVDQIKNHSRAYARRQITWFRRDKSTQWFEPGEIDLILKYIEEKIKP
jgi:tRNA dimethylallyltransferase